MTKNKSSKIIGYSLFAAAAAAAAYGIYKYFKNKSSSSISQYADLIPPTITTPTQISGYDDTAKRVNQAIQRQQKTGQKNLVSSIPAVAAKEYAPSVGVAVATDGEKVAFQAGTSTFGDSGNVGLVKVTKSYAEPTKEQIKTVVSAGSSAFQQLANKLGIAKDNKNLVSAAVMPVNNSSSKSTTKSTATTTPKTIAPTKSTSSSSSNKNVSIGGSTFKVVGKK